MKRAQLVDGHGRAHLRAERRFDGGVIVGIEAIEQAQRDVGRRRWWLRKGAGAGEQSEQDQCMSCHGIGFFK